MVNIDRWFQELSVFPSTNSKPLLIAEIGINHNGDIELAKKLVKMSYENGCDFVKFQKRNPDICIPENKKNQLKETPWAVMTYLEYKKKIEFGFKKKKTIPTRTPHNGEE